MDQLNSNVEIVRWNNMPMRVKFIDYANKLVTLESLNKYNTYQNIPFSNLEPAYFWQKLPILNNTSHPGLLFWGGSAIILFLSSWFIYKKVH